MHELSIILQVVKSVEDVLKQNEPCSLQSFTLQIGEMTDVVPEFMQNAWHSVRESTDFGNAEMIIENVPALAECKKCGYTERVSKFDLLCPKCNSPHLKIISGRELTIKEIAIKSV